VGTRLGKWNSNECLLTIESRFAKNYLRKIAENFLINIEENYSVSIETMEVTVLAVFTIQNG
jgi:hypothetical protein